ncbi:muramoyltetrapeptide carboxypeptidase [Lishizhenia tianjinensis]|uniref:Muramoyltetrapeptide carboxypeptidase n=1 Tax=Lishizhenia tianjinensis TaxID=477690 RepID=A0A1I7BAN3_9FLAO|nr:LD-carboxypeptidase [Lishizhenia tianjinensis]SFT84188.1 muramoyltetrapeptide carboxypeptidase [Lishizhenia tianjinensis]
MNTPPYLKKGDTIAIVAPAKAIEEKHVLVAKTFWEEQGYKVRLGQHVLGQHHYFSGTEDERYADMQTALNDDEVKAIVCARGGYGCVQILDQLNWAGMLDEPKWILGFSDVTFFHQHLNYLGVESIHATMPLNYTDNTQESLESMVNLLEGKATEYTWSCSNATEGEAEGVLLGGNLSIVYSMLGTDAHPNYNNAILYLEEVGEHLYAIDRMFFALQKAGILRKLKGLIIGGMTNIGDTTPGFGQPLEEMIKKHFRFRKLPIAFDFMAGHINDNRALRLGANYRLKVKEGQCELILKD